MEEYDERCMTARGIGSRMKDVIWCMQWNFATKMFIINVDNYKYDPIDSNIYMTLEVLSYIYTMKLWPQNVQ